MNICQYTQRDKDRFYMRKALDLAERGLYSSRPNPRVGCVVVKDSSIVGTGWHQKAGENHAEVDALREAGAEASGATLYVTLEPCNHYGKTPPCAMAVIESGVERVVVAMKDPNPLVAGSGISRLESAGIQVDVGLLEAEARHLNIGFISRMERNKPWVRCKLAMSLDGHTALTSGESKWITGEDARRDVQRLRARSCAVITGVSTIKYDDPSMNVRAEQMEVDFDHYSSPSQPLRVIMDTHLSVPPQARLFSRPGEVLIATCSQHSLSPMLKENPEISVFRQGDKSDEVSPEAVIAELGSRGANEILIEAGSRLSASFLRSNLIDELWIYVAPKLFGSSSRSLFSLPEVHSLAEAQPLELVEALPVGQDVRLVYRPEMSM